MTTTTGSTRANADTATGQVEGIFITTAAGQPMQRLETARLIAGTGLEGDRYALGTGFYSDGQPGRELTLIEAEDLERMERETGVQLAQDECRRNIVTRGIALAPQRDPQCAAASRDAAGWIRFHHRERY